MYALQLQQLKDVLYDKCQLSNLNDNMKKWKESSKILTSKVRQTKINQLEHMNQGHGIL